MKTIIALIFFAVLGGIVWNISTVVFPKEFCAGDEADNFDCYEKHYQQLTEKKSIEAAFADLKKRYPENDYVRSQCHPLTHVIGRTAAQKFPNVSQTYLEGDSFCWSGYYHGVLEGIIGRIGLNHIIPELDHICADIPGKDRYNFDYYNCVHGIGHGLMAITQNELFASLDYCDKLTGSWEKNSCAGGVFMENIIVDNKNHVTKYLRPGEPLYPCTAVPDKYKNPCYLMQTSYMLKVNGGDFAKVFEWCGGIEESLRPTCYNSLGRDASGRTVSDVAQTKAICLLGIKKEQQLHCVVGAVKDFISYFHSDIQARELCSALGDAEIQSVCFSTAGSHYQSFN